MDISFAHFKQSLKFFIQGDDTILDTEWDVLKFYSFAREIGFYLELEDTVPRFLSDVVFLSARTAKLYVNDDLHYVPIYDEDRLRASWQNGDVTGEIVQYFNNQNNKISYKRRSFIRSCNLLIQSYPHKTLYNQIYMYLMHLSRQPSVTNDSDDGSGLRWSEIKFAWLSPYQIEDLYIGSLGRYLPTLLGPTKTYVQHYFCDGSSIKMSSAITKMEGDLPFECRSEVGYCGVAPKCYYCTCLSQENPEEYTLWDYKEKKIKVIKEEKFEDAIHAAVLEYFRNGGEAINLCSDSPTFEADLNAFMDNLFGSKGEKIDVEAIMRSIQIESEDQMNRHDFDWSHVHGPDESGFQKGVEDVAMFITKPLVSAVHYGIEHTPSSVANFLYSLADHRVYPSKTSKETQREAEDQSNRHDKRKNKNSIVKEEKKIVRKARRKLNKKLVKAERKKIVGTLNKNVYNQIKSEVRKQSGGKQNLSKQLGSLGVTMQPKIKPIKSDFKVNMNQSGNMCVIGGTDVLSPSISQSPLDPGTVWLSVLISPVALPFKRLSSIAQFFSLYRFLHFEIQMQPGLGSTQKGAWVIYYDPDVSDDPTTAGEGFTPQANVEDAIAHKGRRVVSMNQQRIRVVMPKNIEWNKRDWYFVNSADRDITLGNQARVSIETMVSTGSTEAVSTGIIMCKWKCVFKDPQTRIPPSISPAQNCYAVIRGNTANGGNLAAGERFWPASVSGISANSYRLQSGVGMDLTADNENASHYSLRLFQNAVYYFTIFHTCTTPDEPTFILEFQGVTPTASPSVTVVRSVSDSTHNTLFCYLDLTIFNGWPMMNGSTQYLDMFIQNNSTTTTTYTTTCIADLRPPLSSYTVPVQYSDPKLRLMDQRLRELESKESKKKMLFDEVQEFTKKKFSFNDEKVESKFNSNLAHHVIFDDEKEKQDFNDYLRIEKDFKDDRKEDVRLSKQAKSPSRDKSPAK